MVQPAQLVHVRLDPSGSAALDELRGIATRVLGKHATYSDAVDVALRFHRAVDQHERARVMQALKQESTGARLLVPGSRH
jgi:hypothetical protein